MFVKYVMLLWVTYFGARFRYYKSDKNNVVSLINFKDIVIVRIFVDSHCMFQLFSMISTHFFALSLFLLTENNCLGSRRTCCYISRLASDKIKSLKMFWGYLKAYDLSMFKITNDQRMVNKIEI